MKNFPEEEEFDREEVDSGQKYHFRLAFALVMDEPPMQCNMAEAEDFIDGDVEKKEYTEILQTLREKFDFETIRAVSKMHGVLGHPSPRALTTSRELMGAKSAWIQCARLYSCEDCLKRQMPKSVSVATLPRASSFNDVVDTDNFHCLWRSKKRIINVIMDEYSRFESDHRIAKETAACEMRIFEKYWLPWAGSPSLLRTDMSGAHMSDKYKCWVERHGIKLELIPEGAHAKLGLIERNHQVRREQLAIYALAFPNDKFSTALRITCGQRNRLRNVGGFSPVQLVLGKIPRLPGTLADSEFHLAEQSAATMQGRHLDDMQRREAGATAFLKANVSNAIRSSLLARSRPTRREYEVGEWAFYWRVLKDESKLEKVHWHGPGLVSLKEPKANEENVVRDHVYWLVHGSAILRCTPELMRPEFPQERDQRELEQNGQQTARDLLSGVRGPVNFYDLSGQNGPDAELFQENVQPQPQPPQQPQQQQQPPQHEEPEAHGPAAAAAGAAAPEDADMEPAEIPEQHMFPTDVPPEPAVEVPVQQPAAAEVPGEPAKADAASSSMDTETSRVRLREKIESLAQQSYEDSCRLDGYRVPGKKPRFDWKTLDQTVQQQAEATPVPVETDPDELMFAEDIFMLFEEDADDMEEIFQTEDTVYFVQKNKNAIVEARLSPDEKRQLTRRKMIA